MSKRMERYQTRGAVKLNRWRMVSINLMMAAATDCLMDALLNRGGVISPVDDRLRELFLILANIADAEKLHSYRVHYEHVVWLNEVGWSEEKRADLRRRLWRDRRCTEADLDEMVRAGRVGLRLYASASPEGR